MRKEGGTVGKMALYKLLCALTVGILLTPNGCLSDKPAILDCGQADRSVKPVDMPWRVTLTNDALADNCSAILVDPKTAVLHEACNTSQDGFSADGTWAYVGAQGNEVKMGVQEIHSPSDSRPGLVKLKNPVNITDYVAPVCLPAKDNVYGDNLDSYVVYDMHSQKDESEIVGPNECDCALGASVFAVDRLCAEEKVGDEDCEDWKGAVHYTYANGTWVLTGLDRYDPNCPHGGDIVAYVDVSQFQDFFINKTGLMDDSFFKYEAVNNTDKYFVCDKSTTRQPMMSTTREPMMSTTREPMMSTTREPMMSTTDPFMPPTKPDCPHPTTTPPPKPPCGPKPCCDPCGDDRDSIFDGGVSLMHCSPFILLGLSVLSLFGSRW